MLLTLAHVEYEQHSGVLYTVVCVCVSMSGKQVHSLRIKTKVPYVC